MNNPVAITSLCSDPTVPVICFPRPMDSVAFFLGRSDFRSYRSKNLDQLLEELDKNERTVLLFAHRNSLATLRLFLPAHLHMTQAAPIGLTDIALIERR